MTSGWSSVGLLWIVTGVLFSVVATAGPLDLMDPTPRWVEVRFEISPPNEPGRLDSSWSPPRQAYLQADAERGTVEIRIPADEMEAHLRTTGTDAVSGSFSEFVWTLDPVSGHVLAAQLTGRVRERVRIGFLRTSVTIDISVQMTTTRADVGFATHKGLLGVETQRFCAPSRRPGRCIPVAAAAFDPERGYVNAVGSLQAASAILEIQAFSPLGEVRFSEHSEEDPRRNESVVSGVSHKDAVCLDGLDRACQADDLGGES